MSAISSEYDISMLFTATGQTPVHGSPVPLATNVVKYLEANTPVRVTRIYDYNTVTGEIKEVDVNDTSGGKDVIKMLYHDRGGYTDKDDLIYQRNFRGDYNKATRISKTAVTDKTINVLYGPDGRAPRKSLIKAGVSLKIDRTINGYVFVRDGTEIGSGWVKASDLNMVNDSGGGSNWNGDALIDKGKNNYTDIVDGTAKKDKFAGSEEIIKAGRFFTIDEDMVRVMNGNGIYDRSQMQYYDRFSRFGIIDPYNSVLTTKEYLFFTKPDLHIFSNGNTSILNPQIARLPVFDDAMKRYAPVLKQMQWSAKGNVSPFVNLLSNTVSSSLDLPSVSANEIETSVNIRGSYLSYRTHSVNSDAAHDFSLEFKDTRYLAVYMFFKLFDAYENQKFYGYVTPPDKHYVFRKILHDQISIYKFIVSEDGETLLYWAKLTGCYPKSVPREAFSDMSNGEGVKFTTQWRAQFVEDMDPQILSDFNDLIRDLYKSTYTKELWLYDQRLEVPDGRWAGIPYIAVPYIKDKPLESKEMQHKYMLKWRI